MKKRDSYFNKIVDNLLEIKGRDQSVMTKVRGSSAYDVFGRFGSAAIVPLMKSVEFNYQLEDKGLVELLKKVKVARNGEKILELFKMYGEAIYKGPREALLNSKKFQAQKTEVVAKLKLKTTEQRQRWLSYIRKAKDENIQGNIWPLHIGTFFVSITNGSSQVYAPLMLKEIQMDYKAGSLSIESLSGWKWNDKLVYTLRSKFGVDIKETNIWDLNGQEAMEKIARKNNWDQPGVDEIFVNPSDFERTKELKVHGGIVIGLFKPQGGNLRSVMKRIVDRKEVDTLLSKSDVEKREKRINDYIATDSENIKRVQLANFSQDKATISALLGDTIIWGPPGTGKSQTIANIVANILFDKKTGIVMSQKKAALDVLKKRMGKLSKYILYILNDNNLDKSVFYNELRELFNRVENYKPLDVPRAKPLITLRELDAIREISKMRKGKKFNKIVDLFQNISKYNLDQKKVARLITILSTFDFSIEYVGVASEDPQRNLELLSRKNEGKLTGIAKIRYRKIIRKAASKYSVMAELGVTENISNLVSTFKKIKINDLKQLFAAAQKLLPKKQIDVKTDYLENTLAGQFNERIEKIKSDKKLLEEYTELRKQVERGFRLPYKFIDDHKNILQKIFKVIITTPYTGFINWKKHSYDYVIVDESSQLFVEVGLPMIDIGKIKIIAGDPQQMRPTRWFSSRVEYDDDADTDENEIELETSLLDYAINKKVYSVMLNKNYRSTSAELMTYSSRHFYESELDVSDSIIEGVDEPIEVISIPGRWESSVNKLEAEYVLRKLKENFDKFETITILTFNSKQRDFIYKKIFKDHKLFAKALNTNKLSIKNIENIQGDEADLIIMSVVYDETTNMGMTYVARPGGMNALNVAISRAKHKMIVVKSVFSGALKDAKTPDYKVFNEWIKFIDMRADQRKAYTIDNELTARRRRLIEVAAFLRENVTTRTVTNIIPNYEIGTQRIDIAFIEEATGKFVAGCVYASSEFGQSSNAVMNYLENISSQQYLESRGYAIYRINEIDWEMNKGKVTQEIWFFLNHLSEEEFANSQAHTEVIEVSVKKRKAPVKKLAKKIADKKIEKIAEIKRAKDELDTSQEIEMAKKKTSKTNADNNKEKVNSKTKSK